MKWTTLDKVITSTLLSRGYPVHFYEQFLKLATDCLRGLNIHTLRSIRTQKLLVNNYRSVTLPSDFVDYVSVSLPTGQYTKPLVSRKITSLNNYDSAGEKAPYGQADNTEIGSWGPGWYTIFNQNREYIGRNYGMGSTDDYGFKVFPERNEIQFDERLETEYIILDYISDGLEYDTATRIDIQAQSTIEHYIIWKMKDSGRHYTRQEVAEAKAEYFNELRILRAVKADWTMGDIVRAVQSSFNIK